MPKYDVAVVGAGIGGLSIAALLARAGRSVLLTDPSDRPGGAVAAYEKDGFRFSAGPGAVYGLEQGGPLRSLCTSFGIEGAAALPPARYQIVMPGRRITVAPSREETLDELRREFPREIDKLSALHRDAEKIALRCASSRFAAFLAGRRSAASFLRTYAFSPEVSAFFTVRAQFFFGQGPDILPLRLLVRMLGTAPVGYPGGYSRIAAQLSTRIADRTGTICWKEPWPELLYRRRRASGIGTSRGTMESRSILVNAGERPLETSIFLGVREEVIPVRMENTVICLPDHRSPGEYYSLELAPRGTNAPAGMRAVTATAPAAVDGASTRDALRAGMRAVMPFLDEYIVTEAYPDGDERCFSLPDQAALRRGDPLSQGPFPARSGMRNLWLMPDSSRSLFSAVLGALKTADRLV